MRYMLLIYGDERVWSSLSEEDMRRIYADHNAYGAEMTKAGVLLGGAELRPVATATSIRFSGGRPEPSTARSRKRKSNSPATT